jgi:hypothetical protein
MIPEHKKGRAMQRKIKTDKAEQTVVAWKGFDKNFQCRGYQFEVGKTYEHTGRVEVCRSGFHACESPMDVWSYYSLGEDNRFAKVTLGGELSRCGDDTKIAGGRITIEAEVRLPDMIRAAVDGVIAATRGKGDNPSGISAQIGSSGNFAKIGSSGYSAQIGSSGISAQIGSSGNFAKIGSSGISAQIGSSGISAQIGSSGNFAKIGSSGYSAQIGSSGISAQIGSSGNSAQIGSSGISAQIGSSGNSAQIGSSGNSARIGSSGDSARIEASGKDAVVSCAGNNACVKAGEGGAICIPYHDGKRVRFAVGYVGEDGIKPDTWYGAAAGRLVPA